MKLIRPQTTCSLVFEDPPQKPSILQRLKNAFTVAERSKSPSADPAPAPVAHRVIKPARLGAHDHSTVATWRGEPMTPTQYYYDPAPDWWRPSSAGIPAVIADQGDMVLGKFDVETWNDMTEDQRMSEIEEWEKIVSLGAYGIKPPTLTPEALEEMRREQELKAKLLERAMEEHKRKLEQELKEAEEKELHYEGNQVFGAF